MKPCVGISTFAPHPSNKTILTFATSLMAAALLLATATAQTTVLYSFNDTTGLIYAPKGAVVADAAGNFYGSASSGGVGDGFGGIFELTPPATKGGHWAESTLYVFTGGADGGYEGWCVPYGDLILDASGNLYGTTPSGGSNYGVVFELSPPAVSGGSWTETVLY